MSQLVKRGESDLGLLRFVAFVLAEAAHRIEKYGAPFAGRRSRKRSVIEHQTEHSGTLAVGIREDQANPPWPFRRRLTEDQILERQLERRDVGGFAARRDAVVDLPAVHRDLQVRPAALACRLGEEGLYPFLAEPQRQPGEP